MITRREFVVLTTLAAGGATMGALLEACGAGGSSGASTDPLVAAAQKEGILSYYSSGNTDAANALATAFSAKYGIQVTNFFTQPTTLAERITSEIKAGKLGGDVVDIDNPVMPQLVDAGYVLSYDPPTRSAIPAMYKTPQWTEFRLYAGGLAWNTNKVKASDAPTDWKDLSDPKWKNRIGIYGMADVTGVEWFDMVEHLYGDDWVRGLAANKPKIYPHGVASANAIVAGEIDLGTIYDYSIPQQKAKGAPFDGIIPQTTYLGGMCMGVLKNAPHPNAAKLFYQYTCSPEGDAAYCNPIKTIPANPDAPTAGAHKVSDIQKVYTFDLTDLANRTPAIVALYNKLMGGA